MFVLVWFQFWSKAKNEPLSASETYHLHELKYRFLGVDEQQLTADQMDDQTRGGNPELPQPEEESESDE
jgi:hypothetical protein